MVKDTQILDQGFRPETQELSGQQTALNLGFLTGNTEMAREIQILRQIFRTETQILIVISSPAYVCIKRISNLEYVQFNGRALTSQLCPVSRLVSL